MKIVSQKLRTLIASMSIKDCKVAHWYFWVEPQILNALIRVLHCLSLAYVTDHSRIKSLHLELECAYSKRIIRFQHEFLIGL